MENGRHSAEQYYILQDLNPKLAEDFLKSIPK